MSKISDFFKGGGKSVKVVVVEPKLATPKYDMGDYVLVDHRLRGGDVKPYIVRVICFKQGTFKEGKMVSNPFYVCQPIDTYMKPLPVAYYVYKPDTVDIDIMYIVRKMSSEEVGRAGLKPGKPSHRSIVSE